MKKIKLTKSFMMVGLVVGVVVLGGCGEKVNQLKDMKDDVTSKVESGKKMIDDGKGLVGGLKDAMKNGVSMKCVSGEDEWVTYTNGKNIRSEGLEDGKTRVVLVTGGVTYTWDKATKMGVKMDKDCLSDLQGETNIEQPGMTEQEDGWDFSVEKLEAEEASGSMKCTPATDADFSVPSDVTFKDQCKIFKAQMGEYKEQMKEMQNKIPSM